MDVIVLLLVSIGALVTGLCNFFQATEPEGPLHAMVALNCALIGELAIVWLIVPNISDRIWCVTIGAALLLSIFDLIHTRSVSQPSETTEVQPPKLLPPTFDPSPIRASTIRTAVIDYRW